MKLLYLNLDNYFFKKIMVLFSIKNRVDKMIKLIQTTKFWLGYHRDTF